MCRVLELAEYGHDEKNSRKKLAGVNTFCKPLRTICEPTLYRVLGIVVWKTAIYIIGFSGSQFNPQGDPVAFIMYGARRSI